MAKLTNGNGRTLHSQKIRKINFQGDSLRMGMNWTEEDLAKLVRLLKSLAPIPRGEPILPNVLPAPTEAELARRQVFLNAAPAIGYDGQALRKRALAPGKLDKEESKRRLREMRDLMFSARQT